MNKKRELAITIIDLFEELLEKHNITIPDVFREYDSDCEARIYGETYYNLEDQITELLETDK